ncbi:MAG: caspase family protein [Afipia sp.]|nr:caspase family protein [Afipia sp.]
MRGWLGFLKVAALVLVAAVVAVPSRAQTPPQPPAAAGQNRIALVIGNGNYQASPRATAANDAGLVAQTLQAAGFDVIGARDLDGETLRRTFHDFIQKAQAAGPDTVAVVYLAGYGLQLAGENYFVPVDAVMARDTDVAVEGLRIGDYVRQLSALPLKATVVVLDAAYAHPFAREGQPLAGGLALMEPAPRGLIAFNAAPGTVAPPTTGNYGPYAQALAEMIRTGGIGLPEVFNRVRLRVNEVTKGAQVPWDAHKLDSDFLFFERAPDAPPVQADQDAALRAKPIRDFSAQDAYTAALARDTLSDYEAFLAAYPDDPLAKRVRAIVAARREATTWREAYRANTERAYWTYLKRYPKGPHAADARRRLAAIAAPPEPPSAFDAYAYDVPPPMPDEYAYVDQPDLMFGDPAYDFAPPPPPPVFYLPPPPDDFVLLDPPFYYDDGPFYLPQPVFIPIPVYIRPPGYVHPPRNGFLFANIHNRDVVNNVINRRPPPGAFGPMPGGRYQPKGPARPAEFAARPGFVPGLPPSARQRSDLIRQGKVAAPAGVLSGPSGRGRMPGSAPTPEQGPRPGAIRPGNMLPGQGPGGPGGRPGENMRPLPGTALPAPSARGPAGPGARPERAVRPDLGGREPGGRGPERAGPGYRPGSPRPEMPSAMRPSPSGPAARPQVQPPQRQQPRFERPSAMPRPDAGPRMSPQFQRPMAVEPRPQMRPPQQPQFQRAPQPPQPQFQRPSQPQPQFQRPQPQAMPPQAMPRPQPQMQMQRPPQPQMAPRPMAPPPAMARPAPPPRPAGPPPRKPPGQ